MKSKLQTLTHCLMTMLLVILTCVTCFASDNKEEVTSIKVGFFHFPGYHEIANDGTKSGYGYDFLRLIAPYGNFKFEYIGYDKSWSEMQNMLERGEIDVLTCAHKSPEREERFLFSNRAIGRSLTFLVANGDMSNFIPGVKSSYQNLRIGLLRDSTRNTSWRKFAMNNNISYNAKYYDSVKVMDDALHRGEINAFVSSDARKLDTRDVILERFDPSFLYVITRKDNTELMAKINTAIDRLDVVSPEWRGALYHKNYILTIADTLNLTEQEKDFIQKFNTSGKKLKITINPDRAPYSYVDANGNPGGIFYDLMKLSADKIGINYDFIATKSTTDYGQLMRDKVVDIVFDCPATPYEAETRGYNVTDSYYIGSFAEIYRKGNAERKSVAIKAGARNLNSLYAPLYGDKIIKEYPSVKASIEAVANGEADCCYMYIYTAANYVAQDTKGVLSYGPISGNFTTFRVAVKQDSNPLIYSIFNKFAASVTDNQMSVLIANHRTEEPHNFSTFVYRNPLTLAGMIAAIIITLSSILGYQERRKRRELEKQAFIIRQERANFRDALLKNADFNFTVDVTEDLIDEEIFTKKGISVLSRVGVNAPCSYNMVGKLFFEKLELTFLDDYKINIQTCADIEEMFDNGQTSEVYRYYSKVLDKYFEIQVLLAENETNNHLFATFIVTDITDNVKEDLLQRQLLKDSIAQMNKANAAKTDFMSQMSHDIRTPMNAIMGMTAIAKTHIDDKARTLDCLNKIDNSSKHLLGLINEILDMSKIEAGKVTLTEEPFNIIELIDNLLVMTNVLIREKEHYLTVNIKHINHKNVLGDPGRIQQIFMNIMGNAIKYTENRGHIIFTLKENHSNVSDYGVYELVFEDNGIGMSKEFMEKIFDPFTRAEDSRTSKIIGTGLGMSITKNIINMMDGTIEVESELNKGSKFTVTIKLKLPEEQDNLQESNNGLDKNLEELDLSGKRALLVEDNEINAEIAGEVLSMMGMQVEYATNGKEAVDMMMQATDKYYDIIFMDIQMPVMNGYEATRAIRSLPGDYSKRVPIIAMTANAFSEDVLASRNAGMNEHLSKPLEIDKLIVVLNKWLEK